MEKTYMIPLKQTILGDEGNCFETCVASLLGISVAKVPSFGKDPENWYKNAKKFVFDYGYDIFAATVPDRGFPEGDYPLSEEVYHIVGGTSPRGLPHAIIFKGPKPFHDPHPSNTGLLSIDTIFVFVPVDPDTNRRY
jgi:hypothetical protein